MKNTFSFILILFSLSLSAQKKIKIKKEDNRFIIFKLGEENDLIVKDKSDLFYIKLPDSLKKELAIIVENGRFTKVKNDSIFKLIPIKGMKYSHTLRDTTFEILLEGSCPASNTIFLEVKNTNTGKSLLQNKFLAK